MKKVVKKTVKKSIKSDIKSKHISFILDETGSMMTNKDKTIRDYNEYITSVKNIKNKVTYTLTKFNSAKIEVVQDKVAPTDIKELTTATYNPQETTPLYDVIGKVVKGLDQEKEVLVVILTDGEENASKEYDKAAIKKLIEEKEKSGWVFVYLGVGRDAWAGGEKLGMKDYTKAITAKGAFSTGRGATLCFAQSGASATRLYMSKNRISK